MKNEWNVECLGLPLDNFDDATVPLHEFIRNQHKYRQYHAGGFDYFRIYDEIAAVIRAVRKHEYFESGLRSEPHVGYDPSTDTHFYIVKLDNNGTTYIITRR